MAVVLHINDNKVQIVEGKNIGFFKAAKDMVTGGELNGFEELVEETFNLAKQSVPQGFEIISSDIKVISDINVAIVLTAARII